jgi:hypothetical protein
MATKKSNQSVEDVVRKEFPQFDIVQTPKPDARFLPPDAKTPDVKKLHRKYNSDSAEETVVENAEPASSETATQAVVIEPKIKHDGQTKRLTVLVKQGKVRAVQG